MLEAADRVNKLPNGKLITIGWEKSIVSRVRFYRFFFLLLTWIADFGKDIVSINLGSGRLFS